MRRRALVLFLVLLSLTVLACKKKAPKAGDICTKEGDFVCAAETKRMVCMSGKYVEESCTECTQKKGLNSSSYSYAGCHAIGVGPEGSACPAEGSFDCDGTQFVKCINGTYHHFKCGGADGCKSKPGAVVCDTSVGTAGDACAEEDNPACSPDKKNMLHCKGGKLVAERTCKGPKSCTIEQKPGETFSINCDTSLGDVGDVCVQGGACSSDKSSVVLCKDNKYVLGTKCRGADPHCVDDGTKIHCADPGVSEVGDPCTDGAACSGDGKAFLECQNGAWKQTSKCKSCKVAAGEVTCTKR